MDKYEVLSYLQSKKNVILMGAPGTGKSKLINEVACAFEEGTVPPAAPIHQPGAAVPIPAVPAATGIGEIELLQRPNRKVFRTTLHQNSKYRDFISGITPKFDGTEGYQISAGILYRANEFAKQADSAALLIIDELNRGPAIEVFGGGIVAIESDKRLAEDNTVANNTQFFEIISPDTNDYVEYAFSPHLYILAAMNQADVSVAPLDVAFLRRWLSIKLFPNYQPLYERFGINEATPIPNDCNEPQDIYTVAIHALSKINDKIAIGRGTEYQLGQGVFLSTNPNGPTLNDALDFMVDCWSMIYSHVEELFFGDANALAYIVNADNPDSPFSLDEVQFAGESRFVLRHEPINRENIFTLYRSILEET